jgi:hypothetical protein
MNRKRLLFLLVAVVLVPVGYLGVILHSNYNNLPPLPPLPVRENNSPLELSVYLPSGPDDLKPVDKWLPSDSLKARIYVIARIKTSRIEKSSFPISPTGIPVSLLPPRLILPESLNSL